MFDSSFDCLKLAQWNGRRRMKLFSLIHYYLPLKKERGPLSKNLTVLGKKNCEEFYKDENDNDTICIRH